MYFLHCIALKPDKNFNLEIKFAWKQKRRLDKQRQNKIAVSYLTEKITVQRQN